MFTAFSEIRLRYYLHKIQYAAYATYRVQMPVHCKGHSHTTCNVEMSIFLKACCGNDGGDLSFLKLKARVNMQTPHMRSVDGTERPNHRGTS